MTQYVRACAIWARIGFTALLLAATFQIASAQTSFIGPLNPGPSVSTVPTNGDVNPYGLTQVPVTTGNLVQGDLLVSNFNNSANLQGTGTTIMEISPAGAVQTFAQIDAGSLPGPCPGGVGLTTALVALRAGWVIVASLPTSDGTAATAQAGCLSAEQHWSGRRNLLRRSNQRPVGRNRFGRGNHC